jgi:hypothetical protein
MDYENNYKYTNFRLIIIIAILFFVANMYFHPLDFLKSKPAINKTPINNTIIVYQTVTIEVTPTPDGETYFASEYQDGIRKLGRYYSWFQKDVEGLHDISGHVKVYGWRQFDTLHIFNAPDYKYYEIMPNRDNATFFIVFVKIYLDDVIGDDVPMWLPRENQYWLLSGGKTYQPMEWDKQLRIKEIEDTPIDDLSSNIEYYGVINTYSRDKKYRDTAGEYAQPVYYVRGGESNAIDGYIIYEIDKGANPEDNIITSAVYSFGSPSWSMRL